MAVIGDVFGLDSVYDKQVTNVENNNYESWPEKNNFIESGYYAGSGPPSTLQPFVRLNFSTETYTNPGNNIPSGRHGIASVQSQSYGYFGGGYGPSYQSEVVRLDFSNDNISLPGNNLLDSRNRSSGTSNNLYGYFGGGAIVSYLSSFDRIDFSNETISNPGKYLLLSRRSMGAASDYSYGYYVGGSTAAIFSTISRLDFSNETAIDRNSYLLIASSKGTQSNSTGNAYFGGGLNPSATNTVSRLDFSSETISNPGKNLPITLYNSATVTNNDYGYFGAGFSPSSPLVGNFTNVHYRLDFFNETISSLPALPTSRADSTGVYGASSLVKSGYYNLTKTKSYFAGGFNSTSNYTSYILRLEFSTDTPSTPGKNLDINVAHSATLSNTEYGYFAGGTSYPFTTQVAISNIRRISFSTETISSPGNDLLFRRHGASGISNKHYGYVLFGNDYNGPLFNQDYIPVTFYNSNTERLDFSNETISSRKGYGLSSGSLHHRTSTSSNVYAYFTGGGVASTVSVFSNTTLNKFDYSIECFTSPFGYSYIPTAPNLNARGHSVCQNNRYAYYIGGPANYLYSCRIHRLDFSTETFTQPPNRAPDELSMPSGTESDSYGYFAGGSVGPPFYHTTLIFRLDFSTETAGSTPARLNGLARSGAAPVSDANFS